LSYFLSSGSTPQYVTDATG